MADNRHPKYLPSPQEIADEKRKIREENEANYRVSSTKHTSTDVTTIRFPKVYKTP